MTLKNERLLIKIKELFDILEQDLDIGDYMHADVIVARLSKYFHLFDDEHSDYYQYAQGVIEEMLGMPEDYYEPTELDEWLDFDPDC